jgi:3'(2'),5'-bisphosphate nucleotidase
MPDIQQIRAIAEQAGQLIMQVYARDFSVADKSDASPLTEADLLAHAHIVQALAALTPDIPVLSEESADEILLERNRWQRFWLVDPLDGTKEFIKKNGEFTVNIALIEQGQPVLGVVHAPALGVTYWGEVGKGAWKAGNGLQAEAIRVSPLPAPGQPWRVVGSRSHASAEFNAFMAEMPDARLLSMGSSLKLCLVAEGSADLYPRLGPTSEWDTAAAHAVVVAAGGQVVDWPGLQPLRYNQHADSLLNPFFMVCAEISEHWAGSSTSRMVYEHREHSSKSEVVWHRTQVTQAMRADALGQTPCCIWLTGLSGSGKSTIANALELELHRAGQHTFLLDGDNVRHGLNKDLGMSVEDRAENIRRVGEVAKLMVDAGLIVVTAFISPFRADREQVRAMFSAGEFIEVFLDTPLAECEKRDPKGLYKKAREGKLKDFTGIDSPYEAPQQAEITLRTHTHSVGQCVEQIQRQLGQIARPRSDKQ